MLGADLFWGDKQQTAEAGYAQAIARMAKAVRSLPRGAWSLGNDARGLLEARRIAQLGAQKLPRSFRTFDLELHPQLQALDAVRRYARMRCVGFDLLVRT